MRLCLGGVALQGEHTGTRESPTRGGHGELVGAGGRSELLGRLLRAPHEAQRLRQPHPDRVAVPALAELAGDLEPASVAPLGEGWLTGEHLDPARRPER